MRGPTLPVPSATPYQGALNRNPLWSSFSQGPRLWLFNQFQLCLLQLNSYQTTLLDSNPLNNKSTSDSQISDTLNEVLFNVGCYADSSLHNYPVPS